MVETIPKPLVATQTTSSSESIRTVLQDLESGHIFIPDYQRDSDQWDDEKKSLFIESVLNNLTVPAFFLCPTNIGGENKLEVIDGQQRLTTLNEFFSKKLRLVAYDKAEYIGESSIHYAGATFDKLPVSFKNTFESYKLPLIQLPYDLKESIRLEIFKRINEGGTPLSPQDIRLAYYGECKPVTFIRLCGIYDKNRPGSYRMIESAQDKHDLTWPWESTNPEYQQEWLNWWNGKQKAVGQTASEMFLWFLIAKYHKEVDAILLNDDYLAKNLRRTFSQRTEEVADIMCAQLKHEASQDTDRKLCNLEDMQNKLFPRFAEWFYVLINKEVPSIGADKYRRLAFFFAAMSECSPNELSDNQWGMIDIFIRKPREMTEKYGIDYPEAKGKWGGPKGQKAQIESYFKVAKTIINGQ
jgi:hypothetical protein